MSLVARAAERIFSRASTLSIGPIGIDFSLEAIHAVQLQSDSGAAPSVRARTSIAFDGSRREFLTNPLQFRSLMRQVLTADDFRGRKAILALPSDMFRTMSVNYRAASGADNDAAAIVAVMQHRLEGELSDFVIDYLPVKNRTKGDERLALVAVSKREEVMALLAMTRKAHLDVQAIEIGPVAVARLVGALSLQDGAENALVINSGRRASYLTLMCGEDLLFDQEVAFGENGLVSQVADSLDMDEEMARNLVLKTGVQSSARDSAVRDVLEESGLVETMSEILKPQFMKIVDEIKRVCLYAAAETRGGSVRHVYLLGSIARWPGSDELLSSMTGVAVKKIPDPLSLFPKSTGAEQDNSNPAPEIVVATGLALRGMRVNG